MEIFCSSWNVSVCNAVFFFFNSLACCKSGGVICGDFFATVFSRYLRFFFSFPWSTCFFFSVFPKINEIYVAVRIPRVPFILGLVSRSMFSIFVFVFSPVFCFVCKVNSKIVSHAAGVYGRMFCTSRNVQMRTVSFFQVLWICDRILPWHHVREFFLILYRS